jgi:NAD(P)-dependent dehydrogenase (short-subunit alcohol dehydrogenase family)
MARGPVPKLDYLKRIVRTIAEFKLNQLYFYMEDSFPLNGQPLVGVLSDTLSQDDWKELVAYAARFHVDIVPAQNSCGHLHKVLRFERYADLAETAHGHVLAPQESSYAFIQSMYEQMIPVFPTPFYNVGCDETWDLGRGKSAPRAQQIGLGRLYIENLLRVHDIVHAYNKQVIFWGDIALEYPDLIKTLPKDMLVATWEYFVHPNYDKWLKPYADVGMKIIVCPWVGNTNLIMPDYEQAAHNIGHFVSEGKKVGAIGMDDTVWNDDGETLYGLNWWSIVYGAATAWEAGIPDAAALDQKYDWAFYRNTDHRFVEAIKQLSHINETLRKTDLGQVYGEDYGGTGNELFWHDPFSPQGQADAKRALPAAPQLRRMAEEAYSVFASSASRARRNADTLPYLEFAALKLDALGMRYIYLQEMAEAYANSLAHQNDPDKRLAEMGLWEITSTNGHLQDLREYTTKLSELYKQLWLSENLATWLPNMLQLYDRQSALWQNKICPIRASRRWFWAEEASAAGGVPWARHGATHEVILAPGRVSGSCEDGATMCRLDGKVAIVTGGAGPGIGHGISRVLARRGAFVAILEIDLEAAEIVRNGIQRAGGRAAIWACDISKAGDVQSVVDRLVQEHGRLDVLVNSAGIGLIRPVADATEEEFDRLASINLRGMWLCCKFAIPQMQRQKGGSIINIASVHSRGTLPLFGLYAATKAGVVGLTRGIAVQYGPNNIRANAVCPGLVDGIQTRQIVAKLTNDVDGWLDDYARRRQAIPQLIQPEDVGRLVAFLASDEARSITGAEIPIDAGMWAQASSRD